MAVTQRLLDAMHAHDADAFAALFAEGYASDQPAHPARAFRGRDQVRKNWSGVFAGVPDFSAELLTFAVDGDTEIGEWVWTGTHLDGSPFEMRGITVLGVTDGVVAWGRLYMEPVESGGVDIQQMVRETYRPSGS